MLSRQEGALRPDSESIPNVRPARVKRGKKMLRLKGCPRCNGDVYFDSDFHGWFEQCLQCGCMHYLQIATKAEKQPRRVKAKEVARAA